MIRSNAFNYINVLDKAADASWVRNEVLANNIANATTPNFKRSDVNFESILMKELQGSGSFNKRIANVDLKELTPIIYKENSNLQYRSDGNNVDIDMESARLADNQIRYNAIVDSINQEFSRLRTVLTGL